MIDKDPNAIYFRGRITADPELKTVGATGTSIARFSVVSSGRYKNKDTGEWIDGEPTFWPCVAWRDLAEHIASSFSKGMEVIVLAHPKTSSWLDAQGTNRSRVGWQVDDIGPSLTHASAQVTRIKSAAGFRPSPQGTNPGDTQATQYNEYPDDEF